MKDLVNKLISNAHVFLLLYGLYGVYEKYETHTFELEQVESQFPQIEADIAKNEAKVKEIQEFVKKADEYKVRVEEVAKNIEAVQRQLPAETNDSQILSFFQKEMSILNIKDPALTPGKETKNVYYIGKDYSLKANGTFLQFLIFLERIGTSDRIYNIKSLKLAVGDGKRKGRFQVINGEVLIEAYRFNPEFRVDRGIQPTTNAGAKP